jgi:DNA excision repair protein ERCC-8
MNQLLFDRSTGNLGPQAFTRIQTSALLRAIQHAPRLRFNGGEKGASLNDDDAGDGAGSQAEPSIDARICAHQAGVNALALDVDGKMYAH